MENVEDTLSAAVIVDDAAPAAIFTVTSPSAIGARSKVKRESEIWLKFDTVPFDETISVSSKPVTDSLNVIVAGIFSAFVGFVVVEVITGTGPAGS